MAFTAWMTQKFNGADLLASLGYEHSPPRCSWSKAVLTEQSLATPGQERTCKIDMLAQDIAVYLKNGQDIPSVAERRPMEHDIDPMLTMVHFHGYFSDSDPPPRDTRDYYESLKLFTRRLGPLCEKKGGIVYENDVIPIVHYAIRSFAEDLVDGKRRLPKIIPHNHAYLHDKIMAIIERTALHADDLLKDDKEWQRLQASIPFEFQRPSAPAGETQIGERADAMRAILRSSLQKDGKTPYDAYVEKAAKALPKVTHAEALRLKKEKAAALVDTALLQCARDVSASGEYAVMADEMASHPEALRIFAAPYVHAAIAEERKTGVYSALIKAHKARHSEDEMGRRAEVVKDCLESVLQSGPSARENYLERLKSDIVDASPHLQAMVLKDKKTMRILDAAILDFTREISQKGLYRHVVSELHERPGELYETVKPYVHKHIAIEEKTRLLLETLAQGHPQENMLSRLADEARQWIASDHQKNATGLFNVNIDRVVKNGIRKYVTENAADEKQWRALMQRRPSDIAESISVYTHAEIEALADSRHRQKATTAKGRQA